MRYTSGMLHAQEILEAALELPGKERDMLLDQLSASLHAGFASVEIEQAWVTEIERRCAGADAGRAVLRDGDQVLDEILADLRARP